MDKYSITSRTTISVDKRRRLLAMVYKYLPSLPDPPEKETADGVLLPNSSPPAAVDAPSGMEDAS
jgi:hypothetical protein